MDNINWDTWQEREDEANMLNPYAGDEAWETWDMLGSKIINRKSEGSIQEQIETAIDNCNDIEDLKELLCNFCETCTSADQFFGPLKIEGKYD